MGSFSRPVETLKSLAQLMQSTVYGAIMTQGTRDPLTGGTLAEPISPWLGLSINLELKIVLEGCEIQGENSPAEDELILKNQSK